MSEPESLATVEGVEAHVRRHSYDRLIMLSDGIFAIATTLAALDVRLPVHRQNLGELLSGGGRSLAVYFLSFVVTIVFWISSRDLFARLRRVDMPLTAMTLAMLCLIALVPAMIRSVYLEGGGDAALRAYALTMFACGLVNVAMWSYAFYRPGMMLAGVTRAYKWRRLASTAGFPILFLPILVLPAESAAKAVVPLVVLFVLFRRVLLPRWLGRTTRS